jgi:hypothetical protein
MTRSIAILLGFLFAVAGHAATPAADDAHHGHHQHEASVIQPPAGQLWPTDEYLRTGMSKIERAIAQAIAHRPVSRERALETARIVEQNVAYIVENCKLPPQPDAALHVVIGRLMTAANGLKEEASREPAIEQLENVLHDYRENFDHAPAEPLHRH